MFYHSNMNLLLKNGNINLVSDYSVKGSDAILSAKLDELSWPIRSGLLTYPASREIKKQQNSSGLHFRKAGSSL